MSDGTAASPGGSRIDARLAAARSQLDRVEPAQLADEVAAGAVLIDLRPEADRLAEGELPGAIAVERIHLEWRLDPTCPDRLPEATPGRVVVVVCNEGYASSLAAADLRSLGVVGATDLVGGFRAWHEAGLPVERA